MMLHMHREIHRLKDSLLELSAEVEKSISFAGKALADFDETIAQQIITNDERINEMEVNIEEDCLKILALYQPVAHDLRTVIAILKINNDLERMADLAVNICRYVLKIKQHGKATVSANFERMFAACLEMVRDCIDSFMNEDVSLAAAVCAHDEIVDEFNIQIITEIQDEILKNKTSSIKSTLFLLSICRTVERIADYATNIAEGVCYMVSGKIVRHTDQI